MISHGRSNAKPEINVDLKEELRNWFITAKVSELENSLENSASGFLRKLHRKFLREPLREFLGEFL